ncbi:MAG: TRAP transporter fused permease subunit [Burkholderiales bacterium]|nr:TRAP transporter fused permease subunit [Burkholderiales bacterium]
MSAAHASPGAWRALQTGRAFLGAGFAIVLTVGAIRIAGFGAFDDFQQRVGAVVVAALVVLLAMPLFGERPRLRWLGLAVDLALLGSLIAAALWYYRIAEELWSGLYAFTQADVVVGCLGLVAVLELSRRAIGPPLFIVSAVALGYALGGEHLPGAIRHAGFQLEATIEVVWYSFNGVFGAPVAVVTAFILIFVLFGALLEAIGTGDALLRVAQRATARTRGGPAHAAIVASGLFGTLSGSTVANVVGTGVFTMPMIKQHGFSARFAGAVEAAASSGGQIMPPVMGAVAFIMADVTGIPYIQVALAALVPSLFYYASLFVYVAVKAGREGIRQASHAPQVRITTQDLWLLTGFVIPLAVIVGVLVAGRSPAIGGFWATLTGLLIGFAVSPPFRREPRRLLAAAVNAGRASAVLLVAVGAVGVIIGVMNMTGLGLKFANAVLSVSGESLFLALLLTMAACLVLGMGMPTVPAYLIIVLVMGPALAKMGISIVAAHLFAVYFAVLSVITPPVALAAFAAAPICGAPPFQVAVESCKVAAVGFIIPFVFVYEPSLLIIDGVDTAGFAWAAFRLSFGLWLLTTGLEGWAFERLGALERLLRAAAGFGLLIPETTSSIAALLLAAVVLRREAAHVLRALAARKLA